MKVYTRNLVQLSLDTLRRRWPPKACVVFFFSTPDMGKFCASPWGGAGNEVRAIRVLLGLLVSGRYKQ